MQLALAAQDCLDLVTVTASLFIAVIPFCILPAILIAGLMIATSED